MYSIYLLCVVIIELLVTQYSNGYVLVQVRKQDDSLSNVDAVIHKVVPSEKVEKIASNFARKQFSQDTNYGKSHIESNLDNIVLAVNTGAKKVEVSKKQDSDIVGKLIKFVSDYATGQPGFRTQEYIKPEILNFRSDKPSVMFEINSKAIIKALKELLSSKTIGKYVDKITKEAAIVYRSLQDELKQG